MSVRPCAVVTRRAESCVNFMKSVKSGNLLLPICEGLLLKNESKYNLRHQVQHKVIANTNRFKGFVTFRYVHSIANLGVALYL